MKRFLMMVASLILLFSCACAEEAKPQTLFTATACVPFAAENDGAVIAITLSANDETLAEAEAKAAALVDAFKVSLMDAGAAEAEISVERTDVQTDRDYHYNKLQEPSLVVIGRSVEYCLTVKVSDIAKLDACLDAIVTNGQYADYTVEKTASAKETAYREALAGAAKDASAKAQALAKACGFNQTVVVSVVELPCEGDCAQVEVTLAANN